MNLEQVKQHIHKWVDNKLSVPSPLFNNLPPCPYSREAMLKNKVDIRCVPGVELLDSVIEIGKTWDDSFELILVACEPDTIRPADLIVGIEKVNRMFEPADLLSFFDHPNCVDPKYTITTPNGKYVLVGMQRLANFLKAAKPLYKKEYFSTVDKQFPVVKKLTELDEL
ncbi:hypothetical protein N8642_04425 [bacterium]|jgi:hypothetical protein|nr:hypothetical protein [Verrucomicrobiota bacterium]MDA7645586.1 hypothetical protein [bacterium]MDB4746140.1 hypothetical protein [Verrucomicrobiota bacterium]